MNFVGRGFMRFDGECFWRVNMGLYGGFYGVRRLM